MDPFSRHELRRLAEQSDDPKASIYIPTYRTGREVRQNRLRFKNLLKRAGERISDRFPRERRIVKRLQEAAALETDDSWWQHQSDALAMFVAADRFDLYRVPLETDELLAVGRRFYVRPMVQLLQGDGQFYILAVSQNHVRLLKGTRHAVEELDPGQLPSDLRSALNIDEFVSSLQQHSVGASQTAGTMVFHGQGGADMSVQKKDEIRQFFHRIDAALNAYLGSDATPLVFAGVDYLFPIFCETCRYGGLIDEPVTGNPDETLADDLHQKAWKVVAPLLAKTQDDAVAAFEDNCSGSNTTADVTEIMHAARQGAVDKLMLARERRRWGVVDEETGNVELTEEDSCNAEELLNCAAVLTLSRNGTVYSLPSESMPNGNEAAALLRFTPSAAAASTTTTPG